MKAISLVRRLFNATVSIDQCAECRCDIHSTAGNHFQICPTNETSIEATRALKLAALSVLCQFCSWAGEFMSVLWLGDTNPSIARKYQPATVLFLTEIMKGKPNILDNYKWMLSLYFVKYSSHWKMFQIKVISISFYSFSATWIIFSLSFVL